MTLPAALAPFLAFPVALRAAGFAASPDQTQNFLAAVGLLGPRSLADVRRAAHAVFGPGPERAADFDAVFDRVFLGHTLTAPAPGAPEDLPRAFDAATFDLMPEADEEEPSGAEASGAERLFARTFPPVDAAGALRAFARALPRRLPRRRSRRMVQGKGRLADPRATFREVLRRDGEIAHLPKRTRLMRQRRVLLLIDISGSMKASTEASLRLGHTLVRTGERVEAFTLGTRLTRVSKALRHRAPDQALALASGLVADWDGGTRLGEALAVFLAIPRFAATARGAFVVVLSDGLERGGPETLVAAMTRLRALAWSVLWLSPLATGPHFRAETAAMRAVAPLVDRIGDGATAGAVMREILAFTKGARP